MAKKLKKSKKTTKNLSKNKGGSDADDLFANAEPSTGFNNLPEGTYEGYIKEGSAVIEPKDGGGRKASMVLVVTSPEDHEDRTQTLRCDLSTQIGVNIFCGELEKLGLGKPDTFKEAAEILSETDNVPVRFWVGPQKDEFPPKVRINERLEDDDNDGEDVTENDTYTKADIKKMTDEELEALADELEIDHESYDEWDEVRDAIYEELEL